MNRLKASADINSVRGDAALSQSGQSVAAEASGSPSQAEANRETVDTDAALTPEEQSAARQEKLAAIRAAIDAGRYDSDELLEIAMSRLRRTLDEDRNHE